MEFKFHSTKTERFKNSIKSRLFWKRHLCGPLADVIFQTLMNVRTQASTVVARTPSAQTAQEAMFAHAQQDMNRQTKPMEKISHAKVSWLRPNLRDYRFIAPISIFNRTGQCYNLSADLFPYDEAWSQ